MEKPQVTGGFCQLYWQNNSQQIHSCSQVHPKYLQTKQQEVEFSLWHIFLATVE